MNIVFSKAKGHSGKKVWCDRSKSRSTGQCWRRYHVFALSLVVCGEGSLWRLIIGPWVIAFRFRGTRAGRRK
ncbi:MAG: hypothetical protein CPSOU_1812 [uncultured Paraburkholderia sp.]|nr:MAG: hypothetical protein CPSOU_1812 [uncultured Paraburkholderia sp.]